jgi:RNA polymerase sigma factor (sigma-70 family)
MDAACDPMALITRVSRLFPWYWDRDELISAGCIGYAIATNTCPATPGTPYEEAWLFNKVRWAMLNAIDINRTHATGVTRQERTVGITSRPLIDDESRQEYEKAASWLRRSQSSSFKHTERKAVDQISVQQAMKRLPTTLRFVVRAYYYAGMSDQQIADRMARVRLSFTVHQVRGIRRRALGMLRTQIH